MPSSQEPLLRRPSDDRIKSSLSLPEEDALLTGENPNPRIKHRQWREIGITSWAILSTILVIVLAVLLSQTQSPKADTSSPSPQGKRNLIFMVSDGMGPTSLTLTRAYRQSVQNLPISDTLTLDRFEIGKSRTRSSSSLITDSAAGATAFSCGQKSYNGAISVLPDHSPCGTVLEAAKRAGYMTGLVVTTRITDATPACFAAHVKRREEEDRIAGQLLGEGPLGRVVDLVLGAGRCHFLGNDTVGSCRSDGRDMLKEAKGQGWNYVGSRKEFDELGFGSSVKLPLLGLFADEDIPYEIDRVHEEDVYPSLDDMTQTALAALHAATHNSDKGFFLMVEGSRIDHAGHTNDPAAQVQEVLAYDRAFQRVQSFLHKDTTPGLLVATSDHETGGLAVARQLEPYTYPEYQWYPAVLGNASHSVTWVAQEYARYLHSKTGMPLAAPFDTKGSGELSEELTVRDASVFLHDAVKEHLGIYNAKDEEIDLIVDKPLEFTGWLLAEMISRRAQTGWTTHGHSGADVNIYASDLSAAKALQGNHENTEIGEFMAKYLDVDVQAVTEELKRESKSWNAKSEGGNWMGQEPAQGENMDGGSHLERYQGDFGRLGRHLH